MNFLSERGLLEDFLYSGKKYRGCCQHVDGLNLRLAGPESLRLLTTLSLSPWTHHMHSNNVPLQFKTIDSKINKPPDLENYPVINP